MSTLLLERYLAIRQRTLELAQPLSEADLTIQSAEFASPGKWHLAHTSWFFEEFLLRPLGQAWTESEAYRFLFNSYYHSVGQQLPQAKRGLITRPGLAEVLAYRERVTEATGELISAGLDAGQTALLELGMQHEQQHQELFLTDLLHHLSHNPLWPAYRPATRVPIASQPARPSTMVAYAGGLYSIGHRGEGFGFDHEFPLHRVYLQPFQLSDSLVSNAEWLQFIEDGGYRNPLLWLADGWHALQQEQWQMPLYWQFDGAYLSMSLHGLQPLDLAAPVCHISFFEADAYARWAGQRLPSEAEWEIAASAQVVEGNLAQQDQLRPLPASEEQSPLRQLYGDVWEWTASPYLAYPGFKPSAGAVGEYNGKFMNGQYVLRGGSCVTPADHIRASYRNFFPPQQRWQFSGVRLAQAYD